MSIWYAFNIMQIKNLHCLICSLLPSLPLTRLLNRFPLHIYPKKEERGKLIISYFVNEKD